jgi:DNA-binding MarR family transcriptional regulator
MPPLMNTPTFQDSGASLGLLFRQLRDAMWARMKLELADLGHDLTFSQYITLKKLAIGSAGVTDLARAAEVHPGAMTRLLDRLVAKGLVARTADPADRRALNIHLTESGLAIWQDINKCGERVRERALHGMSEQERSLLKQLLERARDNLISSES